jgi:hypothetical protein
MIAPRLGQGSHVFHLVKNILSFVLANNLSQDTAHYANVGAERSILMRRCSCTAAAAAAAADGTTRRSRRQELSKQGGIGFGKRRIGGKGSSQEQRRRPAWMQEVAWHPCPLCRSSQSNVPCRRLGGSHVCDNGGTTSTTTTTICGSCDRAPHGRTAAQTVPKIGCSGEVCVFQSVTQRRELLAQTQPVTSYRTAHTLVDCVCTMVCACCLSLSLSDMCPGEKDAKFRRAVRKCRCGCRRDSKFKDSYPV